MEGAEFNVLKGAEKTLKKYSPVIIFEFGLGASDHYNVNPSEFFEFLCTTCNYQVFLLDAFLKNKSSLNQEKFLEVYKNNKEYYFIASPK